MSHKNVQRRSALSFAGADDSIDQYIDKIVQSDPSKNIENIEKSDAAHIQKMLNEFDDRIRQEKTLKAGHSVAKKSPRQSTEKSAMKDSTTTNSEGTSSNMHSNIVVPEIKVQTRKKALRKRTPKTVEKILPETSSQELQHSVDDAKRAIPKMSGPNVKEIAVNESVNKTNKKDVTNMTDINPVTSTPKEKLPQIIEKMAKDKKSTLKKRKLNMTDSENKLKNVKPEKKGQRKRRSKKNAKDIEDCQCEDNKNMPSKEVKTMDMEKLKNNLECNKKNNNALKNKGNHKKMQNNIKVSNKDNNLKMEELKHVLETNIEKNLNTPNKLKNKTKLPKNEQITSNKSPKPLKNNAEDTKNQCKKECAKNCGKYEQRLLKDREESEKRREHRKSKKAAKAMAKLSRQISDVKKKMECIKDDLESDESFDSGSDYSDESSYSSSYSSSSFSSGYSHSSDCSCSECDYYTEYTCDSSDSSISSENSGKHKHKRK